MIILCKNCNYIFETEVKFCSQCGQAVVKNVSSTKLKKVATIIGFYVAMLVYMLLVYYVETTFPNNLEAEIIVVIGFACIVLGFASFDLKPVLQLYNNKAIKFKHIVFAVIAPVVTSFVVYFFIRFINSLVAEGASVNYFQEYLYLDYPLFWATFFIALMPAVIEELAFRGVLFNALKEVTTTRLTIIATAFLFAVIHFSIFSFLWIFPFGLLLGFLRSRYYTLWLGMIIHFIHNFIILMIDYYNFYNY